MRKVDKRRVCGEKWSYYTPSSATRPAVKTFVQTLPGLVFGCLRGFDRLVFRGYLRSLMSASGMNVYLWTNGVTFRDFKAHAQQRTDQLIAASEGVAKRQDRPVEYLRSPQMRKEDRARELAKRDGITDGLIGMFTCVEPCWSYTVRGNGGTKRLELRSELRQCLHLYHYYQHPRFGLMYARVQTWFPFTVQIGINGREWLCRSLDAAGLEYRRSDNCVTWVEDIAWAQKLLDGQLRVNWSRRLHEVRGWVHPTHPELLGKYKADYYWTLSQSEWATDVLFRDRQELQRRYGSWLRFALTSYSSPDVLRFLGKKLPGHGGVNGHYEGEVLSDLGRRVDGLRIKHRAGANSVKMYDKAQGSVLRVETTINDPSEFKVYRGKEGDESGEMQLRQLRSGVADVHRRAEVSEASNERYLAGLAATTCAEPLKAVAAQLSRRVREPGRGERRVRGLNLLGDEDAAVLAVVGRPEFGLNGLRNRDVVAGLYAKPTTDETEQRRRSSRATRLLRLLRAHGILQKVPKSHRYRVSERGRMVITAVLAARNAATEKLVALAA